ncbi:MAG: phosphotransferase family protein [Candidatus Dormibacteraeota bacterium]|nr:phosphotransferase family protein [Candidatus Dormibacteraeota bacterium]MDQ6899479.1 phosphotransferase family protein [Candidatus Dormibacteraeota bacterium]
MTIQHDLERALGRRVLAVDLVPEGHSGFTYRTHLEGGQQGILRLPPPGARIAGPADIPRQGRIMQALSGGGLPVPEVIAMSEESIIDGRPFVLMAAVDGERIEKVAGLMSDEEVALSGIEALQRIHALPLEMTGIGDEHAVTPDEEVTRWVWLMKRAPEQLTRRAPTLAALLSANLPPVAQPTLVHGDYHFGNMLFRDRRVVAILDWEIAEVGQPLLDLACLSLAARTGRAGAGVPGGGQVDVTDDLLLNWYGADAAGYWWYLALTYYKYAAIFGYNLMLHRRGKRLDPMYESRTETIVEFIDEGIRLLQEGSV